MVSKDKVIRPDPIISDNQDAFITPDPFIYTPPPVTITGLTPNPSILDETSKVSLVEPGVSEQQMVTAKPGDVIPYVFGHTLVTPLLYTIVDEGNGALLLDYIIGQGVCYEVDKIIQYGSTFDITGNSFTGWEFYMGEASQVASPQINAALGSPDSYDTLDGICHVVAQINSKTSPDIQFIVRGMRLEDPRLGSPSLSATDSTNPALVLARIFRDSGYLVNDAQLIIAADFCDEQVGSPQAARWSFNMPIYNRASLYKWAHTVAQHGSLLVDIRGTEVFLIPAGKVTASPQITHTATINDMQAPRTTHQGVSKVPEKVSVNYRETDGTTGVASAGTGSAGRVTRLRMPGFNTFTMSSRKATEVLNQAQLSIVHSHRTFDKGLEPLLGELADITYTPHQLAAERMRLVDYVQPTIGRWNLEYRQYSDSVYVDSQFSTTAPPTNPPTDPPGEVPAGPTPVLTQECFSAGYGRIKVTFTESSWPHAAFYLVRVAPTGDPGGAEEILNELIAHTGEGSHTKYTAEAYMGDLTVSPIVPATEYTAQLYVISATGVLGSLTSVTFTPSAFEQTVCALQPKLWFKFDDDDFTTTITDSGSTGADLTSQNTIDASVGSAMRSTRSGSLEMPAFTNPNWSTEAAHYTEAADVIHDLTTGNLGTWVFSLKLAASTSEQHIFFAFGAVHTAHTTSAYSTHMLTNGYLTTGVNGTSGNSQTDSNPTIIDDATTHIIVIRNGGNSGNANALEVWIDGVLEGGPTNSNRSPETRVGEQFNLGGQHGTYDTPAWNSDCLAYWDTVLTDQQVADLQTTYAAEIA